MADPRLYLAPASAGKTAFVLEEARHAARGLEHEVRLVVSGRQQVRSCRRRLAQSGGALGVRVMTFDQLYQELLYRPFPVVNEALFRAVENGVIGHRVIEFHHDGSILAVRGYYLGSEP